MLLKKLKNKIAYFSLKKEDVLISSFPKVGSTFTRFVLANIINLKYEVAEKVNFHNINIIMPELGHKNMKMKWEYSPIPRLVKTHDNFDRNFMKLAHILYIIRDPRDTMISFHSYATARKSMQAPAKLEDFVKDKNFGIPALNKHFEGYFEHASLIFKYEDLMLKPVECFDDFLNRMLHLNISEELIAKAVDLSRPDKVKNEEKTTGRPSSNKFSSEFNFIRNAGVNQWQSDLEPSISDLILKNSCQLFTKLGYK